MTHTTTTTAMRISKPNTAPTHTTLIKLVLVINFFTLLRAAWLLHPSQSTKTSCDLTDFSSTPITSTSSLTMAPAHSKDTNSKMISCADSRSAKNKIATKPKPKGLSSIGSLSNLSIQQIAAVVSPDKGGKFFECNQPGMVDVDLTSGMTGTGPNGAVDLTNDGTEDGSNDGILTDDEILNGGMMDGLNGSTNGTQVVVSSLDVWHPYTKPSSNSETTAVVVGKGEAEAAAAVVAAEAAVVAEAEKQQQTAAAEAAAAVVAAAAEAADAAAAEAEAAAGVATAAEAAAAAAAAAALAAASAKATATAAVDEAVVAPEEASTAAGTVVDVSGDGCNDTTMGGVSNTNTAKRVAFSIHSSVHEQTEPPTEDMDIDGNYPKASFNLDVNTALNSKQSSNAGVNEELKTPV